MSDIKKLIQSHYPTIDEMPFCAALRDGRFERREILRAEIVELYRALNTRGIIQELYKEKLQVALGAGQIEQNDLEVMTEVIDDEGETEEHIDHLDMRFKLFEGTPVSRATTLDHNEELEAINNEWMAVTAGIEDWYAPLSKFFEDEYRKRGFAEDELELFIAHQVADVDHSEAQFDILERSKPHLDEQKVKATLTRTFATSKGYDAMKLKLAEAECELQDLLAA